MTPISPRNLALVLGAIAIIILSSSCAKLDSQVATSPSSPPAVTQEVSPPADIPTGLPEGLGNRVIEDLAQRTGIAAQELTVLRYSKETWPDGCLGLGGADEFCTAVLVEGWQIEVVATADESLSWFYRTNLTGENFRLAGEGKG